MGRLEEWLASISKRSGEDARPLVTLSYAQSIDGSIALHRGQPLALSGGEGLKLTHRLRADHDAVLVGIGTILADDPQLNVRLVPGKDPQVIVLDSRLRLPSTARIHQGGRHLSVFCTALAPVEAQEFLGASGALVERQEANETDRVDLKILLARLATLGINTLMVEGGGQVISSFLAAGLVDRAVITVAPRFIGGYRAVDQTGEADGTLPRLHEMQFEKFGEDLVVWGDLEPA
jgi:3,4-dihydroxy 2-butanone 4-phosphate synthase/GTP cyclohydrolase II